VHASIKDFRSLAGRHEFDLASGLNYFVGPNNVGKSNVLRAIELALDPDSSYDPTAIGQRAIRSSAVMQQRGSYSRSLSGELGPTRP